MQVPRHRYADCPSFVARDPRLSAQAKGFYYCLSTYTGPNGTYPTQERLAEDMGASVDTVARWAKELQGLGYIQVFPRYDAKRLRCGVRYVLRATVEMYRERASLAAVDTDSASMRSPDSASMRSRDSASMRSDESLEATSPKTPLAPLPPASGGQGGTTGPDRGPARTRQERATLDKLARYEGEPCYVCNRALEGQDVAFLTMWNGRRVTAIVESAPGKARHRGCAEPQSAAPVKEELEVLPLVICPECGRESTDGTEHKRACSRHYRRRVA